MTNLIPDSWELPSYTAGDVYDLDAHRALQTYERGGPREDYEWEEGEGAPVVRFPEAIHAQVPEWTDSDPHSDWTEAAKALREIEPYDPAKHGPMEPGDLTSVDSLQALEREGFEPHEPGVWHRRVRHENGDPTGMHHIITYEPGNRRPTTDERAPWILTTDPETAGVAFRHLDGPTGALAAANEDRAQIRRMSKLGTFIRRLHKAAAGQSRGRRDADDWLERNTDESFEHVPEVSNEAWMRAHEGLGEDEGYTTWHPEIGDYTYDDVGDASGWEFSGDDEARPTAMPGHFRDENRALDSPSSYGRGWSQQDYEDHREIERERQRAMHPPTRQYEDEEEEPAEDDEEVRMSNALAAHGFNWEPKDPSAGSSGNPISPETPGKWVKHQMDTEGRHVATHTLTNDEGNRPGQWKVDTELGEHGDPVTFPTSVHGEGESGLEWALHKYKSNAAEAMLPRYGYQPEYGPANIRRWTKTAPGPRAIDGEEDYEHEIVFPDHGFGGTTTNHTHMTHPGWSPNGSKYSHSDDLADVVREQQRMEQGIHPGGSQDHRLTSDELLAHPSVSRLGRPTAWSTALGDGKIMSMGWRIPTPASDQTPPIHALAEYNWDTGNYDFKYRDHYGSWLAHTHNYVPDGAPIRVPGGGHRQPQLPLEM